MWGFLGVLKVEDFLLCIHLCLEISGDPVCKIYAYLAQPELATMGKG